MAVVGETFVGSYHHIYLEVISQGAFQVEGRPFNEDGV